MVKGKVWRVTGPIVGNLERSSFVLEDIELPVLKDGEVLTETIYLSVDPYMKAFGARQKKGEVVAAHYKIDNRVAKVTESRNAKFPVGTLVIGTEGWTTHSVSDGSNLQPLPKEIGDRSPSHALGALGNTGHCGYCAFLDVCKPTADDVVLFNSAAGAVGCLMVQIAKAVGCKKIIAYAGTDEKCEWLKELGADHVYNYKKTNLEETIKEAAPDGIDCFVDSVGGEMLVTVLNHMRHKGRVCIFGSISQYNKTPGQEDKVIFPSLKVIATEVSMSGWMAPHQEHRKPAAFGALAEWEKQGKVKFYETVKKGFENMPDALMSLFTGEMNRGKVIVEI